MTSACSGRTSPFVIAGVSDDGGVRDAQSSPTDVGPRDAHPFDAGPVGLGRDAMGSELAPVDTGPRPDSGPTRPPGPCQDGSEGCACTSNIGPDASAFLQDDCDSDLLCVPFDLLSGRQDLTGPVQSCVRPCNTDSECGPGRACTLSGLDPQFGTPSICVDRVAGYDEFCGLSRRLRSRVPDIILETPGEIVGCEAGYECLIGQFGDLHPDEGICEDLCQSNQDCAVPTPYCNPAAFQRNDSTGAPVLVGVCATGRYRQGSICGSIDPSKVGMASGCDTSSGTPDNTFCIPIGGLTPDGQGICMTICDDGGQFGACTAREPDGRAQTCSSGFFSSGAGVCTSGCSNYPDTCAGDGELGNGRFCMAYLSDDSQDPVGICMDRRGPILTPATFDGEGNVVDPGDNCFGPGGSLGFAQCPDPGHCEIVDFQQGVGICMFGCGEPGTPGQAAHCDGALGTMGTAACVPAFSTGGQMNTDQGICTEAQP